MVSHNGQSNLIPFFFSFILVLGTPGSRTALRVPGIYHGFKLDRRLRSFPSGSGWRLVVFAGRSDNSDSTYELPIAGATYLE